ncbi:MAG: hypothetical protein ABWJ98_07470 [Hydrogenothermaceae bacterium]
MAINVYKNFKNKVSKQEYEECVKISLENLKDIKENIKKLVSSDVEFGILVEKQKETILKFIDIYVEKILTKYPDEKVARKIYIAGRRLLLNNISDDSICITK